MIEFRNYNKYPKRLKSAWQFRDEYNNTPDGAFFQLAEDMGLTHALMELGGWEVKNTDWKANNDN